MLSLLTAPLPHHILLQIDLSAPGRWLLCLLQHTYYLLPLCVHATLPLLLPLVPSRAAEALLLPLPPSLQQLYSFQGVLGPLIACALGSYCLDSKNAFCFFPGAPYFYRVLRCQLCEGPESLQAQLQRVRVWAIGKEPERDKSSHWWFRELDEGARAAFAQVAAAPQIESMFRTLFSVANYCVDVIEDMNEVYVSGTLPSPILPLPCILPPTLP
ncbi:hypothetical protein EON64_03195 [archaeon]|nr:MAG: hypothetical protein EON64_03195 [archaeon]